MWTTLSIRQRRVLIGLSFANLILLAAIGVLAVAPAPQPATTPAPVPDTALTCRSAAARALVEHDVAGTVAILPAGSIEFTIGDDDPASAWDAFAVSAELPARGCGPYDPIRIDVPDPSLAPNRRLVVEARWADVQAWWLGRIDDETLSERTRRSTYVRPSAP